MTDAPSQFWKGPVVKRRLLIIDPAVEAAEVEGAQEIAAGWRGDVTVLLPALRGDRFSGIDPEQLAGVVVMGSAASVHDQLGWLGDLEQWLEPMLSGRARTPVLGICFGHQLLAHCFGARVELLRSDRSKELGVRTSRFSSSRLFPDGAYRVVVSHNEVVTDLPPCLHRTASRTDVTTDAFEHTSLPVFGVQFHPEGRAEFAARRGIRLGDDLPMIRRDGQRVLSAFRNLLQTSAQPSQAG